MESIRGIKTSLIEISESDAEYIMLLRNDPRYNRFLFQQPLTLADQVDWIREQKKNPNSINFKIVDEANQFKGTASIYDIYERRGLFGRYIASSPIQAIEAEYLILKYSFDILGLDTVFAVVNIENRKVWKQHLRMGFKTIGESQVVLSRVPPIEVTEVRQEISRKEFYEFDFEKILQLLALL